MKVKFMVDFSECHHQEDMCGGRIKRKVGSIQERKCVDKEN
jgi:hypothetical protein